MSTKLISETNLRVMKWIPVELLEPNEGGDTFVNVSTDELFASSHLIRRISTGAIDQDTVILNHIMAIVYRALGKARYITENSGVFGFDSDQHSDVFLAVAGSESLHQAYLEYIKEYSDEFEMDGVFYQTIFEVKSVRLAAIAKEEKLHNKNTPNAVFNPSNVPNTFNDNEMSPIVTLIPEWANGKLRTVSIGGRNALIEPDNIRLPREVLSAAWYSYKTGGSPYFGMPDSLLSTNNRRNTGALNTPGISTNVLHLSGDNLLITIALNYTGQSRDEYIADIAAWEFDDWNTPDYRLNIEDFRPISGIADALTFTPFGIGFARDEYGVVTDYVSIMHNASSKNNAFAEDIVRFNPYVIVPKVITKNDKLFKIKSGWWNDVGIFLAGGSTLTNYQSPANINALLSIRNRFEQMKLLKVGYRFTSAAYGTQNTFIDYFNIIEGVVDLHYLLVAKNPATSQKISDITALHQSAVDAKNTVNTFLKNTVIKPKDSMKPWIFTTSEKDIALLEIELHFDQIFLAALSDAQEGHEFFVSYQNQISDATFGVLESLIRNIDAHQLLFSFGNQRLIQTIDLTVSKLRKVFNMNDLIQSIAEQNVDVLKLAKRVVGKVWGEASVRGTLSTLAGRDINEHPEIFYKTFGSVKMDDIEVDDTMFSVVADSISLMAMHSSSTASPNSTTPVFRAAHNASHKSQSVENYIQDIMGARDYDALFSGFSRLIALLVSLGYSVNFVSLAEELYYVKTDPNMSYGDGDRIHEMKKKWARDYVTNNKKTQGV